ncbi:class I SAM-dependent methyltransferase [Gorillibacterium massiliense]|uniref:class I SAM-dependent methyltransferase n=1 Tax=Gorillibacterium massiliense TaxID=1280390 RepID=UPI0004B20A78|nr:rRNA adenine N-6-methyltransferase family protein [Gorillibacterium massiliense]
MEWVSFIRQYAHRPRIVGAVAPSSKYLAGKMVEDIDFGHAEYIVEYGPGTGVFTEKLLAKRKPHTVIILVEYNSIFYSMLKEKYGREPNVHIIHDSAEHIDKYLAQYGISQVDYFVSGLPFASLSAAVSSGILAKSQQYLKEDGKFITFQYTLLKKGLISRYFGEIRIKREIRNFPPAYVFNCSAGVDNTEAKRGGNGEGNSFDRG